MFTYLKEFSFLLLQYCMSYPSLHLLNFIPPQVTDKEAFFRCHQLAKREGLLVGGSAGLNVEAALRIANEAEVRLSWATRCCTSTGRCQL